MIPNIATRRERGGRPSLPCGCRLRQQSVDLLLQALVCWAGHARISARHLAVAPDQVLIEVPARFFAGGSGQLSVKGRRLRPLDRALGKHREFHAKGILAKSPDLLVAAGFLLEVVGRKTEHHQTLVLVACIQRFQTGVLARETAIACRIYD